MSFKDFWTGNGNIRLPEKEYLYGTRHIVVLILVLVAIIALSLIFHKKSKKAKSIVLTTLVSILLFFEITSRIVNLITADNYSWETVLKILLPLHICSVAVFVILIAHFSKLQFLRNFAVQLGLVATLAFLLYPAVGFNYKYADFGCIYSITSHSVGFVTSILYIVFGYVDYKFKDIWKSYLAFAIMFGWGAIVDFAIFPGSNYMYLVIDPLELKMNFPYQVLYLMILIVYVLMFYLIPFVIRKIKNKKSS